MLISGTLTSKFFWPILAWNVKFRLLLFVCFGGVGKGKEECRLVVVGISQTATGYTHSGNSIRVLFMMNS